MWWSVKRVFEMFTGWQTLSLLAGPSGITYRGLIVTARNRKTHRNTAEVLGEILETFRNRSSSVYSYDYMMIITVSCYLSRGHLRAQRGKFTNTRRAQEADLAHSPLDE